MSQRRRSTRSRVVEAVLVLAAVLGIYLWMANGGPSAFGGWFANLLGTP